MDKSANCISSVLQGQHERRKRRGSQLSLSAKVKTEQDALILPRGNVTLFSHHDLLTPALRCLNGWMHPMGGVNQLLLMSLLWVHPIVITRGSMLYSETQ